MRFPSDDELMAGPNAFGDARIEVAPDAADPEADARAQIDAGLGEETADEAGAGHAHPCGSGNAGGRICVMVAQHSWCFVSVLRVP